VTIDVFHVPLYSEIWITVFYKLLLKYIVFTYLIFIKVWSQYKQLPHSDTFLGGNIVLCLILMYVMEKV